MAEHPGGLVPFNSGSGMDWTQPTAGCEIIPARAVRDYGVELFAALCTCMHAWSSVTGRACPVHGHIAPMQITC